MNDSDPRFGLFERGYVFDVTTTGTEVVTLDIPTRYAGFSGISYITPRLTGKSAYVGALFTSGYHEDAGKLQLTAIAAIVRFVTSAPH